MGRPLRIGLHSPYFGSTYGGGEKYLGTVAEVLHHAFPQHRVEIVSPVPVDAERYRRALGLDLDGVDLRSETRHVTSAHRLAARLRPLRGLRNAVLSRQAARHTAGYDLWVDMVYAIPVRSAARRSAVLCQFPYELRTIRMREDLRTFAPIVCQSRYVQSCVARIWEREAEVLYPPIDLPADEPDWPGKRPLVLSVGRFMARGHVKRHDVLVRAFRQLCDGGLTGWELVLAGSLHRDPESQEYLRGVEELARGYPVRVLTDASGETLRTLYREASLYWHAAGFDVDAERHPEALEHFGMTTVEAMAHGAVPVVIGRGGQPEVVTDGEDGYLWTTLPELVGRTRQLIDAPDLRDGLARAARISSRRFGRPVFASGLLALLAPIVAELEAS